MARLAPVAFVLVASACQAIAPAAWHRIEPPAVLKRPHKEKHAQVWSHGQVEVWRALVMSPDSITGIPAGLSVKCDTCRRAIAWPGADSVRLKRVRPVQTSLWIVALLIGLAAVPP